MLTDLYLGGTTVCWNGLCIAEAILAMSLLHATPAEHVYPEHTVAHYIHTYGVAYDTVAQHEGIMLLGMVFLT